MERIDKAKEQLSLLKQNSNLFSIKEKLGMASVIRDNLSSDESVIAECNGNPHTSEERKQLLDEIQNFQLSLIKENIHKIEDVPFERFRVLDFEKAKIELSQIADNELKSNLFSESEVPPLYENIVDCKAHIDTLNRVSTNCKYGKYKVLIMGDFESGKSTTLDAFCDGRHISAIGKGSATSAVLVSATYAEKESIIIHWRQKEQFYPIFDRIKPFLPEILWDSFDLDSQSSRLEVYNAIEDLRNGANCPNIANGDAKFLMICSFILFYYGKNELQEKKNLLSSVSDVSNITRFPEKGEGTWEKSGIDKFTMDDVIFVFVDYVECFIPSETLRELNCTIIDSPGLFNSAYDTMVTEKAMKEAHAIMYILPYNKGIGMDVCQSLYTIKNNYADIHRKLFIANNLILTNDHDFYESNNLILTNDNDFYESNCEQIESMFGSEKMVYQYDGKLAYLAQLRKLFMSGTAEEKDYSHLMTVVTKTIKKFVSKKFDHFDDAWLYHTKKYQLPDMPVDEILESCGFCDLIRELKQFIAQNESHAVVISNGLSPMRNELVSVGNSMFRSYIEPYISSLDSLIDLWKIRIDKAIKFQEYVRTLAKEKLFGSNGHNQSLLDRISEEEYSKLFTDDFYNTLSEKVSGVLYDNKGKLLATKTLLKTDKSKFQQRFMELSSPWIRDEIEKLISSKIEHLIDYMESGQDKTVENMFTPIVDVLENELKQHWANSFNDDKGVSMSDYLAIPKNLSFSKRDGIGQTGYESDRLFGNDVCVTLLGGMIAQISATVAGISTMIAAYISAILCDPTGVSETVVLAISALVGIGGLVVTSIAPDAIRNQFIKILSHEIKPKIRDNADHGFRNVVKTHFENTFNKYIGNLSVNINKLKNERDIAITPNPCKESLCFRSLESIINIQKQIQIYDQYKSNNLEDETI